MAFEPDGIGRYLQSKSFAHLEGSEFRTNVIHLHRENNNIDQLKCSSTHKEYAAPDLHAIMISNEWWEGSQNSLSNSSNAPIKTNQTEMIANPDKNVARIFMD